MKPRRAGAGDAMNRSAGIDSEDPEKDLTFVTNRKRVWLKWTVRVIVLVCIAWGVFLVFMLQELRRDRNAVTFQSSNGPNWASYEIPGVNRPQTISVHDATAKIGDDEQIFGVVVNGKSRAYRVETMRDKLSHIVNDVVGNEAVTVSYCDLSQCVRVYHDAKSAEPLSVSVAGLLDGEMVVMVGGVRYVHKTNEPLRPLESPPPLPFDQLVPVRMSWKEWRTLHPKADIYIGQ